MRVVRASAAAPTPALPAPALGNVPDGSKSTKCRIPDKINTTRNGSHTCESLLNTTNAHGWTGDGSIGYKVPGHASRVRQLKGSPRV